MYYSPTIRAAYLELHKSVESQLAEKLAGPLAETMLKHASVAPVIRAAYPSKEIK